MSDKIWQILNKRSNKEKLKEEDIIEILLENRGITSKKERSEFINPADPLSLSVKDFGIDQKDLKKGVKRIVEAKENNERVVIFGDYDSDGICATAILWELLYSLKLNVMPFIPNRFSDGYGIKPESIEKIKKEYPDLSLIITVDNGIVANPAIEYAQNNGIDVIITDHHEPNEKYPEAFCIIHTKEICGAGVSWVFAREIEKSITQNDTQASTLLELAAIGTISDQMPLKGVSRSLVKHGLKVLRKTKRMGLRLLLEDAGVKPEVVGTYEIGFVIAPRINAMGRLGEGIDSLRLICAKNTQKAKELALLMGQTNTKRQKIVEEVVFHAQSAALTETSQGVILLWGENYHEGIIGLAASKLVEAFSRPAIVVSKGEKISKGSARSISGIHITQILREINLFSEIGGHEMAAGFSIETENLPILKQKLEEITAPLLTPELLAKKLKVDTELKFSEISWELSEKLVQFEPTGTGNPAPLFVSFGVVLKDTKAVGQGGKHLKCKVAQGETTFDAIAFGHGTTNHKNIEIDIVYGLETNVWNGVSSLQLKVKDIRPSTIS